jgi:predicted RNase H-like nuclease (RuvC/YqgF family)
MSDQETTGNNRTFDVEHRVTRLERQIEEMQRDNKAISNTLATLQASVDQITSSLTRILSLEVDMKAIREKIFSVEVKLGSMQDLKNLMIGTLVAASSGAGAVILDLLLKFIAGH